MRLLLIHPEARYFSGAETMLSYFLPALASAGCEVAVAVAPGSKVAAELPSSVRKVSIPDNTTFSVANLAKQAKALRRLREQFHYEVVHGWAARDWELTALVGRLASRPAVGTLHDHPRARFISRSRRLLMRLCAAYGLHRVVCVSDAVQTACVAAGYHERKLQTIHNGLPSTAGEPKAGPAELVRLGFLGVFSERKGLRQLFGILAALAERTESQRAWEVWLGGQPQDAAGEELLTEIRQTHSEKPWWNRVHWCGWVRDPNQFFQGIDLLIFTSADFDPFPTVLLEAGRAGVPAVAACVGGVAEIVREGETGWLFEPGDWQRGGELVAAAVNEPERLRTASAAVAVFVRREFRIERMVAEYLEVYAALTGRAQSSSGRT
jgi:glycosyltransferase involved in cell wall biosynthesis